MTLRCGDPKKMRRELNEVDKALDQRLRELRMLGPVVDGAEPIQTREVEALRKTRREIREEMRLK